MAIAEQLPYANCLLRVNFGDETPHNCLYSVCFLVMLRSQNQAICPIYSHFDNFRRQSSEDFL